MAIKKKIVLEVYMPDERSQLKAKRIVAMTEGFLSMTVDTIYNQIVLVGEGINVATLTTKLRKKVGRTTILSVEEVKSEEKKEEEAAKRKKQEEKKRQAENSRNIVPWSYNQYAPSRGYDLVQSGASRYKKSWFSW